MGSGFRFTRMGQEGGFGVGGLDRGEDRPVYYTWAVLSIHQILHTISSSRFIHVGTNVRLLGPSDGLGV